MNKSKVANAKSIEARIIKYMKSLGTYKVEFSDMIKIYSGMLSQYQLALEQFIVEDEQYEVATEAGSTKKSGTASALEVLRKDINVYSDKLMLNPKALDCVESKKDDKDMLSTILIEFSKEGTE